MNGIAYQLFDIIKSRQGVDVSNEIWRLYEQTEELTILQNSVCTKEKVERT